MRIIYIFENNWINHEYLVKREIKYKRTKTDTITTQKRLDYQR